MAPASNTPASAAMAARAEVSRSANGARALTRPSVGQADSAVKNPARARAAGTERYEDGGAGVLICGDPTSERSVSCG
ncbi:hypothetical protein GCM10010302_41780 [Streptomyces polychromogenes]|uniref:Uncharacterized protein n=1 Tax=Streptomyces polychromogenes TaxID=67342 RepID=A0ABP3F3R5_9ACTN